MPELATPTDHPPLFRRGALPRWEPPYDDEISDPDGPVPVEALGAIAARGVALTLPVELAATRAAQAPPSLQLVAPAPDTVEAAGTPRRGRVPALPRQGLAEDDDLPRTPRSELPDPRPWAARLVQVLVEVLAAERPASQVMRHVSLAVYGDLVATPRRATAGRGRPAAAPQVTSVRVSEPDDGVAEVSAVVRRHGRYRAVAFRLEGLGGRWRCTALQVG